MNIVCEKCKRAYVKGQWVVAVIPIEASRSTVCPNCLAKGDKGEDGGGMAFTHNRRKINTEKHNL